MTLNDAEKLLGQILMRIAGLETSLRSVRRDCRRTRQGLREVREEIRADMAALRRQIHPPDCRADILRVLRAAGKRMTTGQVLDALERSGAIHGERTIKGELAALVKDGTLTKDATAEPPGYAPA